MPKEALSAVITLSVVCARKQDTDSVEAGEARRARLAVGAVATTRRLRKLATGRPDARDTDVDARSNLYTAEAVGALFARRARLVAEAAEANLIAIACTINVTRFLNTVAIDTDESIRAVSVLCAVATAAAAGELTARDAKV